MHNFMNTSKAIDLGNPFWEETERSGLSNLLAHHAGNGYLVDEVGHEFINMCSYSYLGLDAHPEMLNGAIAGLRNAGTLNSSISRVRIRLPILENAEAAMSALFNVKALTTSSCASGAAAILPLIASGLFTDGTPPVMVFDKHAHFSLNLLKPICADETQVITCPHNDLDYLEDVCKTHKAVAYVADGVYSTGGCAPVQSLLALQDKYGLFLFLDEAHGLSAYGKQGRGYVLEEMGGALNDRTLIVASLNKGFGASGGALLMHAHQDLSIIKRFGGPLSWSQRINTAGLGAIIASVDIHKSAELPRLQERLQDNIAHFDRLIRTEHAGDGLPIRFIPIGSESETIQCAQELFRNGFYASPLFFPIIPKGKAGLRVMLRANLESAEIERFCAIVTAYRNNALLVADLQD
ncbi:aminotransferase class I and II (plasmid) [Ralstonia solanacearum]|nr:aminotransferase class I and II [Ralstonia solanacearum]